ncbi:MAG: ATP-grasp domain-containing protein [Pseudanabaenaceae cyanobacterium SKYGB_i_bin29]|nr:ATP-grasp domain-containing protein [Pseudanabaenaceae cyanobacterium SKYG29]MDW8420780.1 ATP-grasp domain-containing protein [Pseudanabaenaceae cyanobacterium SKYGB_i_bin29]
MKRQDSFKKDLAIAIGSSGSATGYTAVSALKNSFGRQGYRVIACDTNPRHLVAAATVADDFLQLPPAVDPEFVPKTIDLFKSQNIGYFYPIHDQEIIATAKAREVFQANNITPCCVGVEAAKLCTDKLESTRRLLKEGIHVPKTYLLSEGIDFANRLIVKDRYGNGSKFVQVIETEKELEIMTAKVESNIDDYVVQEWIDEPEVTIDAFFPSNYSFGKVVCRKRLEIKSGVTTKAHIFYDPIYFDVAYKIAKSFNLFGSFCFQTRGQDNFVIDVNPRIGGATAMSVALGIDFPSAHVACFLGHEPRSYLKQEYRECFVTRSYREHIAYA